MQSAPHQNRVTLYYRAGTSDKVYQTAIEPDGGHFVVNFAYGRRGATLTTGTKTSSPVDYDTARQIHTKLVGEKKAKGYTEGLDGTPYEHSDKQPSGILPQLPNPVEEAEVEALLRDDSYCAQEKFDGRHLLIRKEDERIEGINKKGLIVGLPQTVANDLRCISGSFIPDGESVGDDYHAFDLLELHGDNFAPVAVSGPVRPAGGSPAVNHFGIRACPAGRNRVQDPAKDRALGTAAAGKPGGHRVQTA